MSFIEKIWTKIDPKYRFFTLETFNGGVFIALGVLLLVLNYTGAFDLVVVLAEFLTPFGAGAIILYGLWLILRKRFITK